MMTDPQETVLHYLDQAAEVLAAYEQVETADMVATTLIIEVAKMIQVECNTDK